MIVRRLFSRTGVALAAAGVVLAAALPAQAVVPEPDRAPAGAVKPTGVVEVGAVKQLTSAADKRFCLTFVAAQKVPMAVMMACAPGKEGKTQEWVYTATGQLQVAMSKSVGGALARSGACLDTGADLVEVPKNAPVLVLPCRAGAGQKWNYDETTGSFVNAASGLALSSLMGQGKAKQAQPTGTAPANGIATQGWLGLPLPNIDILGATLALVNGMLGGLGLELPAPIADAASLLLGLLQGQTAVSAEISLLPKQMMQQAQK